MAERDDFSMLVDRRIAGHPLTSLDLPAGTSAREAAEALDWLFHQDQDLDRLALEVGGRHVGVTSRLHITGSAEIRGGQQPGAREGGTLPGYSTRYRMLRFTCSQCDAIRLLLRFDPAARPQCPNGHGFLELA